MRPWLWPSKGVKWLFSQGVEWNLAANLLLSKNSCELRLIVIPHHGSIACWGCEAPAARSVACRGCSIQHRPVHYRIGPALSASSAAGRRRRQRAEGVVGRRWVGSPGRGPQTEGWCAHLTLHHGQQGSDLYRRSARQLPGGSAAYTRAYFVTARPHTSCPPLVSRGTPRAVVPRLFNANTHF